MSAQVDSIIPIVLNEPPVKPSDFLCHLEKHPATPLSTLLEPFKAYESELRAVYAQQPQHEILRDGLTNLVPVYSGHEALVKIHARDLTSETATESEKFVMPLSKKERKTDGSPAIVSSLKEFQNNFSLFSESSLVDMDWSNVVAAGSAVTTSLLPVPDKWAESKRNLRECNIPFDTLSFAHQF
jgi:hypothetical protein